MEVKEDDYNYMIKDQIEDWVGLGYSINNSKSLSELNANYIHTMKMDNHPLSLWLSILNEYYYWEENIYDDDVEKDEQTIEEQMKAWATNPERRR